MRENAAAYAGRACFAIFPAQMAACATVSRPEALFTRRHSNKKRGRQLIPEESSNAMSSGVARRASGSSAPAASANPELEAARCMRELEAMLMSATEGYSWDGAYVHWISSA